MARLVVLTDDLVARLITGTWPEKGAMHEGSMGLAALCGSSFDWPKTFRCVPVPSARRSARVPRADLRALARPF